MTQTKEHFQYHLIENGHCKSAVTEVIAETSVSITVNGQFWLSLMCTPTDLEAMAVGFLYNEGIIHSYDAIASVRVCPTGDNIDVWLNHNAKKPEVWKRTSGCTGGVTAVQSSAVKNSNIPGDNGSSPEVGLIGPDLHSNGVIMTPNQICNMVDQLIASQSLYRQAGGVHTSALSDGQTTHVVVEDIGRHNTLDKIAGRILLESIDLPQKILITTGRISSEMLQKASRLGTPIVISRTSPSSLSIRMAEKQGITLIGYARRASFRVYTHPNRVRLPNPTHNI